MRTSPLLPVRWLFPVKKTEGLTSPSFAETLWKLVGRGQRQEREAPEQFHEAFESPASDWPEKIIFSFPLLCHLELMVVHPDITPNVAFAALFFFIPPVYQTC